LFKRVDNITIFGFVTANTVTDIYYIAKKDKGHSIAIEFIGNLVQIVDILGIDKKIILEALAANLIDFEDSIQSVASGINGIDFIITRNIRDFKDSSVKAITPIDFLNLVLKNK